MTQCEKFPGCSSSINTVIGVLIDYLANEVISGGGKHPGFESVGDIIDIMEINVVFLVDSLAILQSDLPVRSQVLRMTCADGSSGVKLD